MAFRRNWKGRNHAFDPTLRLSGSEARRGAERHEPPSNPTKTAPNIFRPASRDWRDVMMAAVWYAPGPHPSESALCKLIIISRHVRIILILVPLQVTQHHQSPRHCRIPLSFSRSAARKSPPDVQMLTRSAPGGGAGTDAATAWLSDQPPAGDRPVRPPISTAPQPPSSQPSPE